VKLEGIGTITCRKCRYRVEGTATWCPQCGEALCRFGGASPLLVAIAGAVFLAMMMAIAWGLFAH
jgi:hypothetical protein